MRKIALVTGAAKGIGKELIKEFSKLQYETIIVYNNSEKQALSLKKEIEQEYDIKPIIIKCDITNESEIINLKSFIEQEYGKIDVLINNAAYAVDNYIDEKSKEEFMKVLEVNVVGTFLVTKHLYKYLNDNGVIVNVSSTDAINTYNEISMDYCASKAAVNSLTKTFSLAFKNLKVIGVMPNWTNTESIREMNPEFLKQELLRIGQEKLEEPDQVARNIINLVNDKNVKSGDIKEV